MRDLDLIRELEGEMKWWAHAELAPAAIVKSNTCVISELETCGSLRE